MADAELRLKATLDDDASRGIDQLDSRIQKSGQAAADANKNVGRSAAAAAAEQGKSASRIVQAYQSVTRAARTTASGVHSAFRTATSTATGFVTSIKNVGSTIERTKGKLRDFGSVAKRAISDPKTSIAQFKDGFRSAGAAASSFSGEMGTLGGTTRKAFDGIKRGAAGLSSSFNAAADAGAQAGRKFRDNFKAKLKDVSADLKNTLKNGAIVAGAAVGAAFVLQLGAAIKNAGALEQSMGAIKAIFKDSAAEMYGFSNAAAETVGLSKLEYQELSTLIGAQLKNGGMAMDELAGKTNELVTVGADLSSMFGGTTREAVEALNSALRGENDPIEKYGITLTAAKVEAEAAALGFEKVGGALETNAKQAAILSLIQQQSVDSMGNFQRETDTFSGSLQILKARWADVTTQWASYVLPVLGRLIGFIGGPVMDAIERMSNGWAAFWVFLDGGDSADWGVLTGFELTAQNAGLALHNLASSAGNTLPVVAGYLGGILTSLSPLLPALKGFASQAGEGFTQLGVTVGQAFAIIVPALLPVIEGLAKVTAKILELTGPLLPVLIPLLGGAFLAFKALSVVGAIWGGITTAISLTAAVIRVLPALIHAVPFIGWAALAISALVLMYQKVGWFRDAVDGAMTWITGAFRNAADWTVEAWRNAGDLLAVTWAAIKAAPAAVVAWWQTTAIPLWDAGVRALGTVMMWLKDNIITPVWNGIRLLIAIQVGILMTLWDGVVWLVRNTLGPVFTWLKDNIIVPVWNGIRSAVSAAWAFMRDQVFNPLIGFVRGALTAAWRWLIDGVIRPVWTSIRNAVSSAWTFMRDSVLTPTINFVRGALTAAWRWLVDGVIRPVWSTIRTLMSNAWAFIRNSVLQPIINFIRGPITSAWNWLRDVVRDRWNGAVNLLKSGWSTIKSKVFDPMTNFVRNTIPDAFRRAVDAVRKQWDRVVTTVRTPVDKVVGIIKDTLIGNINKVLKFFKMDPIKLEASGSFRSTGGGFRDGGYTGAGHPGAAAGVVHRDEHVIKAPSRRSIENAAPGYLDALNVRGASALPSFGYNGHVDGAGAHGGMAAGGPGGPGTYLWGPLQNSIYASGVAHLTGSAAGYDIGAMARAWNNMSNVNVKYGRGPNQITVGGGAPAGTWGYAWTNGTIRLNESIPGNMKTGTGAHEVGHVLGLDHAGTNSIMHPMMRGPLWPSAFDRATMRRIYGGAGKGNPPEGGGGGIDIIGMLSAGLDALWQRANTGGIAGDLAVGAGKWLFGKAKDWISDKVPGASRGMVLQGYSPRTDQTPVIASQGESILTPELTSALGPANIEAANLASSGAKTPGTTRKALGMLGTQGNGGATVVVQMDVTIQGNADRDALNELRDDLERALSNIIEDNMRRGY